MRDTLLFDLDGTVAHTDPIHETVFRALFTAHGVALEEDFYSRHVIGSSNAAIFAHFLPDHPDHRALSAEKEATFRASLPTPFPPTAGLSALLARAEAEGWRRAIVTNAPPANAEATLEATGLARHFDLIVSGAALGRSKPDPFPYQEAMRHLGVTPDRAIAFEDSPSGARAARRSGAFTVGVRSSLSDQDLRQAGAHLTIQDFTDPALEPLLGAA
ncbi:HAD family hydrolase [Acidimangrovimonas sediminis]|uniref:HAD family hydrolase n=1 Tax=Acidimangrovimonas sediminis TaxID=2056283 RepID=UPI000C7FE35E|nr:HAD family phosphatase [Acidimangrovimonas sediminis]